jgi:hypothetical protein
LGVGVGAAELVLDQLLRPLMAQFETYRSEADLIVADEDLWRASRRHRSRLPSVWSRCSLGSERSPAGKR